MIRQQYCYIFAASPGQLVVLRWGATNQVRLSFACPFFMRLPSLSEYLKKKFTLLFFAVALDGHYSQAINVLTSVFNLTSCVAVVFREMIAVGGYYLFEPILSHVQPFQRNSHSLSWC